MNITDQQDVKTVLQMLADQVGGRLMISVREAGPLIGISGRTAQNRVSAGTFPVPIIADGGRARVRLFDVARYLVGVNAAKRGRPTNAERRARQQAAGGVE